MTLEEIYYISQVIAAAAVIASLIYLAVQTRQAARSSRAAMHESRAATVLHHIEKWSDANFSEIWFKGNTGSADMTDDEARRYTLQVGGVIVMWEERFRQRKEGMLDQSRWAASENSIKLRCGVPLLRMKRRWLPSLQHDVMCGLPSRAAPAVRTYSPR